MAHHEKKKNTEKLVEKIEWVGNTPYKVILHFNETSKENVYDKLKRIIVNDISSGHIYSNNEKSP